MMGLRLGILALLVFGALGTDARLSRRFGLDWLNQYKNLNGEESNVEINANVKEEYIEQKLCHFNPDVTGTWNQRFWRNDAYYKDNGLQFLKIGGEAAETNTPITNEKLPLVNWAKQFGARLWNLEHRYYGKSRPLANQHVRNLLFLNCRQALEDIADFIKAKNQELKIKNPKWVIFGRSYSGALALWFREWHPELSVGAVGSSAPIELTADFFDYLRVCEDSYRSYNSKCADNIKIGFESLRSMLDSENGRDTIDQVFNLDPPLSKQELTYPHLQNFYMTILDNFMGAVQYSRVNRAPFDKGASIPDVCKIMTGPAFNPVARLVNVNAYITEQFGGNSSVTYNDYEADVAALADTSWDSEVAGTRSWIWQTCNEFGYFQSTTYNGIFGTYLPIDYYYNLCTDIFGKKYNVDYVQSRVQIRIGDFKRAKDYNGTNVVIPNGSLDPWHALGTYAQNNPTAIPYLIDGAAHCADAEAPSESDPASLKKVRELITQKLQEWTGIKPTTVLRANRFDAHEEILQLEQNVKREEEPAVFRKAPEFDAEICWNCGVPKNDYQPQSAPADLVERMESKMLSGFSNPIPDYKQPNGKVEGVQTGWVVQPLDHFNRSDTRTFNQKFISNTQFYMDGGPIFLYVGGAAPLDSFWITQKTMPLVEWAKKHNATLYALEHRFYGDSVATKDLSLANLQYLTSEQALADAATFIHTINNKNAKWIVYGGSYSGSLAMWLREKYPDKVHAAIASSAPVEARVDFYGYLQTLQSILADYDEECADSLNDAFDAIHTAYTTVEGRKELNEKLSVVPAFAAESIDHFDTMAFYISLLENLMASVQYSDLYGGGVGIVCKALTNPDEPDPIVRYQHARNDTTTYHSMADIISYYQQDDRSRALFWQTCNEFGLYPSTDMGYNAFGSALPINYFLRVCSEVFDKSLTRGQIEKNIEKTNQRYGGAENYHASRVIALYGSADPGRLAGLYGEDHGEDVVSILIEGTSSCSDMYGAEKSGNPDAMKQALESVGNYLDKWLKA